MYCEFRSDLIWRPEPVLACRDKHGFGTPDTPRREVYRDCGRAEPVAPGDLTQWASIAVSLGLARARRSPEARGFPRAANSRNSPKSTTLGPAITQQRYARQRGSFATSMPAASRENAGKIRRSEPTR